MREPLQLIFMFLCVELSKRQVQQLMFDELQHFRPIELGMFMHFWCLSPFLISVCAESKGGAAREVCF